MADITIDLLVNDKKLNKATKGVTKRFDKIKKSGKGIFDGLQNALGNLGGGISNVTSDMGNFVAQIAKLGSVAGPIGIAVVGLIASFAGLTIGILKAEKAERKFLNVFGKIDKRALIQSKVLQQTTDANEESLLKSANTVSKVFGVSISDAFALIKQGFDKGANANGELLSILEEYPTQFKSIGLGAKETFALITKFAIDAVPKDFGADAVKEFGINIRAMSKRTQEGLADIGINYKTLSKDIQDGSITQFEAMQLVSKKLLELPETSREAQEGLTAVFGAKGEDVGREFLTTITEVNLQLSEIPDRISDIEIAQTRMIAQWELFKQNIFDTDGAISKLSANLFGNMAGALERINIFFELNFVTRMKAVWNKLVGFMAKKIFFVVNPLLGLLKLIPGLEDSKIIKTIEGLTKGNVFKFDISKEVAVGREEVRRLTDLTGTSDEKKKDTSLANALARQKAEAERLRKLEADRLAAEKGKAKGKGKEGTTITGGQTKSIVLNIDKIVDTIEITQAQDPLEIKDLVTRALITALADASQFSS